MEMLLPDWEKKEMNVEKAKEKAQINNLSKFSDIRFTDIPSWQIQYITNREIRQFPNICSSETCPEGQEEMME